MPLARKTVFLFDVDNTLLDNDRVTADLRKHLGRRSERRRPQSTGKYLNASAMSLATRIISARCSVTGSRIRTT